MMGRSRIHHGARGWRCNWRLPFVAALVLVGLAGCGVEQQSDLVQPNSAAVSLNITMPANVSAAPRPTHRLVAIVQQWLFPADAWAATAADLSMLQVEVTAPDLSSPVRKGIEIPNPLTGGAVVEVVLDVPVGRDRVFTASGLDRQGRQILRGKSTPITLEVGRTASVDIMLSDNTIITGAITGTVINAATQSPINGARVQLSGAISAVTAGDGQFTLTEVSQGSQVLRVSAAGFNDATQTVTVVAGQTVSAGTIALTLRNITGTINGRILSDGDADTPVAGATVAVLNTTPPLSVPTGADGRFTLTGVTQGAQILQISASGFNAATRDVTVVAGQTVSTGTIALIPIPTTGTVTGSIFTEGNADNPVAGATVAVINTTPPLSVRTGTNGRFTLTGVPQGAQALRVSAQGFNDATRTVTVVAGQTVSTEPIALTPFPTTGRVTGTVTNAATNRPLDDANVAVNGTTISTETQPDGSFTLDGVLQGAQTLRVSIQGFNDATRAVTVVAGQSVSAGTIALTSTTGTITGTVINGSTQAAIQGATVAVNGLSLSTMTISDGNFTLEGIPQGSQTLTVSAGGFTSTTRDVTVPAGGSGSAGTIPLTQTIPPEPTVTGTVTNALTRSPISGASVRIVNTNLQATTDTNGNFTLNGVPQGPQTVEASASGFITNSVQVSVGAGQTPTDGISLSPDTLAPGEIRIILNWGTTPTDLDSHLLVPSTPPFEIVFFNKGTLTASPFALLDIDDTSGFGPETITIAAPSAVPPPRFAGTYCYFVRNFSGEAPLTASGARVQVVTGDNDTELARFTVPTTGTGRDWEVFTLDGTTGAITEVNRIADRACGLPPPPSPPPLTPPPPPPINLKPVE